MMWSSPCLVISQCHQKPWYISGRPPTMTVRHRPHTDVPFHDSWHSDPIPNYPANCPTIASLLSSCSIDGILCASTRVHHVATTAHRCYHTYLLRRRFPPTWDLPRGRIRAPGARDEVRCLRRSKKLIILTIHLPIWILLLWEVGPLNSVVPTIIGQERRERDT